MVWMVTKVLITAALVVAITEAAKISNKLGGVMAALPWVTVLTLVWLHVEQQPAEKIANHAWYTFWYVVPTLPMFLLFPTLIHKLGFGWALAISVGITAIVFLGFAAIVARFGIRLL